MDREVVAILLADLLVLTAVLATAVQPLLAEMRLLLRLLLKPVRLMQEKRATLRLDRRLEEQLLRDRMLGLQETIRPLPQLTQASLERLRPRPISLEAQALVRTRYSRG
jgi:hypothetical protein